MGGVEKRKARSSTRARFTARKVWYCRLLRVRSAEPPPTVFSSSSKPSGTGSWPLRTSRTSVMYDATLYACVCAGVVCGCVCW